VVVVLVVPVADLVHCRVVMVVAFAVSLVGISLQLHVLFL